MRRLVEAREPTIDAAFETEASRRRLSRMLVRMFEIQHFSRTQLAATNRAWKIIRECRESSTTTTKGPGSWRTPFESLFLHSNPWAHAQRSSSTRVENLLIVALQSGWES